MTRERENELLEERSERRRLMRAAIQRIVDARLAGRRDDDAIDELGRLSRAEVQMTRPEFDVAA